MKTFLTLLLITIITNTVSAHCGSCAIDNQTKYKHKKEHAKEYIKPNMNNSDIDLAKELNLTKDEIKKFNKINDKFALKVNELKNKFNKQKNKLQKDYQKELKTILNEDQFNKYKELSTSK